MDKMCYLKGLLLGLSFYILLLNVCAQDQSGYAVNEISNISRFAQANPGLINPAADLFQYPGTQAPYVISSPSVGTAPLNVTIKVIGMDQIPFFRWELDSNGDGIKDKDGQGFPYVQTTFNRSGCYAPTFTFYNRYSQIIAQARGYITVNASGIQTLQDVSPAIVRSGSILQSLATIFLPLNS